MTHWFASSNEPIIMGKDIIVAENEQFIKKIMNTIITTKDQTTTSNKLMQLQKTRCNKHHSIFQTHRTK